MKNNKRYNPQKSTTAYKSSKRCLEKDEVTLNEIAKPTRKYIEDMDVLDFRGKRNPKVFDDASQKLETFISTHYGRNGHIFNHYEEYEFPELGEVEDGAFKKANDPNGIFKTQYMEELKARTKKVNEYNDNNTKVYAIIWSHCTQALQHKIRESDEFVDFDIQKEPLPLWLRIREILLTDAGLYQNKR